MPKVDGSISSLLQGVSQQPERDRLPGQCTSMQNMSADPITGLTRRPGTDLIDELIWAQNVRGWYNFETRDRNRWIACFRRSNVHVWDLTGREVEVINETGASDFLNNGSDNLRYFTIEDTTYVSNRHLVPSIIEWQSRPYLNAQSQNSRRQCALIQVTGGQYNKAYSFFVNGVLQGQVITPSGEETIHAVEIRTTHIANNLANDIYSRLSQYGWNVMTKQDIILLWHDDHDPVTVATSDDFGNTLLKVTGMTVPRVEDLPLFAPHNYVVRVAQSADPETDLWFRFIVEGKEDDWGTESGFGFFGQSGYWQETIAPWTPYAIDKFTMPFQLKFDPYDNNGTWTHRFRFGPIDWNERKIGTRVSNPDPSFIGGNIMDVSTFQGRLVLLSGPNVIMSRSNRQHDFWIASVSQQAASDPIDIRSKVEASEMQAAVQHNRDLVVFANKGQFLISGRSALTPSNAALVLTSNFDAELRAKPLGAGRNVFFATNFGQWTGIREFYAESGTDINDSRDVTQHARKYIKGRAVKLTASTNYNMLLVHTDNASNEVYLYQYIWTDTEKIQSAWSKLDFSTPVQYSFFYDDELYLIARNGDAYHLLRMSWDMQDDPGVNYHVHLDQRWEVSPVQTEFLLPFAYLGNHDLMFIQGPGCPNPGMAIPADWWWSSSDNAWRVRLKSNTGMQGGTVICGVRFWSEYEPTMPMVKDEDGTKIGTGRLTINKFLVSVANTGEIIGEVLYNDYGGPAAPKIRFNGRIVGDYRNRVGEQPNISEMFYVPFRHQADKASISLWTDSQLPMTILDIEWDGQYTKTGRRITGG